MEYTKIILLIIGVVNAIPTSDEDTTFNKDIYEDYLTVYTSKYDIVNIIVPTNSFNFDENDKIDDIDDYHHRIIIFFVEAEVKNDERIDKGLYVLKNRKVTKILDEGRDAAASADDTKEVFFAAKDGIYIYNALKNKAEKYGTVTDNIIALVKENGTDVIYYLNNNHELYKVTENGHKSIKINEVIAQEIVLDLQNNLYFNTKDKNVFVYNDDGVKKIEGLPENPEHIKLIKPPVVIKDSAILLSGNTFYGITANGTCQKSHFNVESDARPTAYAMEAGIFQYYSYNKKIYRYNLIRQIYGPPFKELLSIMYEESSETVYRSLVPLAKLENNYIFNF